MLEPIVVSWLVPVADLIPVFAPISVHTDDLCSGEPPPAETWGFSDIVAALNPATHTFEIDKLKRMALASVWPTYCEYTPAPTTATFANPTLLGYDVVNQNTFASGPAFDDYAGSYPQADFWLIETLLVTMSSDGSIPYIQNPDGVHFYGDCDVGAFQVGLLPNVNLVVPGYNYGMHLGYKDYPTDSVPASGVFAYTGHWRVWRPTNGEWIFSISAWSFNGPPRSLAWPVAPPTPTDIPEWTPAQVATVMAMADAWPGFLATAENAQRSYNPFGYLRGTSATGLTGSGSVSASHAIGVAVQITATPTGTVSLPGNPLYVRDLGWISVDGGDGMVAERRVSQLSFAWFPPAMPLADAIDYDFFPGVVATITPLLPLP